MHVIDLLYNNVFFVNLKYKSFDLVKTIYCPDRGQFKKVHHKLMSQNKLQKKEKGYLFFQNAYTQSQNR